jgi:translation initiation factor eIF-2B subunit alpha
MERIDVVIFGSESIMENGGIVNKIGSLSIAVVAKSFNKKVYVLAESTKFSMGVPLVCNCILLVG